MGQKSPEPNLGLITVTSLLPPYQLLPVVDLSFQSLSAGDWRAAAVLSTGMTIKEEHAVSLIREAKPRGKIVVVGGVGFIPLPVGDGPVTYASPQ